MAFGASPAVSAAMLEGLLQKKPLCAGKVIARSVGFCGAVAMPCCAGSCASPGRLSIRFLACPYALSILLSVHLYACAYTLCVLLIIQLAFCNNFFPVLLIIGVFIGAYLFRMLDSIGFVSGAYLFCMLGFIGFLVST